MDFVFHSSKTQIPKCGETETSKLFLYNVLIAQSGARGCREPHGTRKKKKKKCDSVPLIPSVCKVAAAKEPTTM